MKKSGGLFLFLIVFLLLGQLIDAANTASAAPATTTPAPTQVSSSGGVNVWSWFTMIFTGGSGSSSSTTKTTTKTTSTTKPSAPSTTLRTTSGAPASGGTAVSLLGRVGTTIIGLGNLNFLGLKETAILVGLTRILLWILIFALIYSVLRGFNRGANRGPLAQLTNGQAGVIAGVMATISAIFLPVEVMLAVGGGWATAISLLLIGAPIAGFLYLLLTFPQGRPATAGENLFKFFVCVIAIFMISIMIQYLVPHLAAMGVKP